MRKVMVRMVLAVGAAAALVVTAVAVLPDGQAAGQAACYPPAVILLGRWNGWPSRLGRPTSRALVE